MSPWIRRALVAGGFGTGVPLGDIPAEVAPVVPYRELGSEFARRTANAQLPIADPEKGAVRKSTGSASSTSSERIADPTSTPFFHFSLEKAVKAAELGALKANSRVAEERKA